MSMFVRSVSAYQQLQNWSAGQSVVNSQIFGSNGAGATDFSSAFTDAAYNTYSSSATLAANQALGRVQSQSAAKSAKSSSGTTTSTADTRLAAAQAAGQAQLASLGLDPASQFTPAKSASSSSGPYQAPTNAATGYAYVATSAAQLNALNAVNILT
jgi:hypothetical protein